MSPMKSLLVAGMALLAVAFLSNAPAEAARDHASSAVAPGSGTLVVSTVNTQGKPVAGALVNVFPAGSSTVAASGTTGSKGKVSFGGLAPGDYSIFASKVEIVFGFPIATFGTGSATVGGKGKTSVTITLDRFAP